MKANECVHPKSPINPAPVNFALDQEGEYKKMKRMGGQIKFCVTILLISALSLSTVSMASSNEFISGKLTQEGAMRLVYGNYKSQDDTSSGWGPSSEWRPTDSCSPSVLERIFGERGLYRPDPKESYGATVVLFAPYETKTGREYLMVTETSTDNCHACGAITGIFVFNQVADRWHLKKSNKCFAVLGTWGHLPGGMHVVKIGQNKFGVLMFVSQQSQGFAEEIGLLVAEYQNDFAILFSKLTAESNYATDRCYANDDECYKYESSLTFVPGKSPEFYDIVLKQEGTKGVDESGQTIEKNRWSKTLGFVFKNGKYQEK